MYGPAKRPRDRFPYPRAPQSRMLTVRESVGQYAFVVDLDERIHVVPDGRHVHPTVLGHARPALYAGELSIDRPGSVDEVTNLSGTFRFKSRRSLCCVVDGLSKLGFAVLDVVWFPPDGSGPPIQLSCP